MEAVLCAYLDRSNIGNAASAGMLEDLNMTRGELGSTYPSTPRETIMTN
jgi:hypothetical protein